MKLYSDLHIHSCLSPCGEEEMTPNNIIGMSVLKGLEVIAVCDHNTTKNIPAAFAVAQEMGIILVPGIEVSTAEDVHLLVYFNEIGNAAAFGDLIYESLPDIPCNEKLFGSQLILNEMDEVVGKLNKLLTQASVYSFDEAIALAKKYNGVPVPAHVNKSAYSVFANLGFLPEGLGLSTIEVYKKSPLPPMDISKYKHLHNSDAHQLEDISEPVEQIHVSDKSLNSVFEYLK